MLSVPCHPVGSEGGHQGDRTTGLRARSEPGASVLPLAASFSTGARCRDAPCGRLYTWRQASLHLAPGVSTPGARHHLHPAPGIIPAPIRPGDIIQGAGARRPQGASLHQAPGITSIWRQASPPSGARHHLHPAPGIVPAPIRPGDIIQGAGARRPQGASLHQAPGITSIWRQASPPSGTRHHPGANQAGRYHPGRRGKTPARGVSTFHVRPSPRNVETPLAGVFLLVRPPAPGFEGQHGENGQTGLRIGKYNNAQRREICYTLLNGSVDEPLWLLDTRKKDDSMSENTYVAPTESAAEMARLIDQDRLVTEAMGGLFPPDLDPKAVRAVLDVGCGPGGWAREVAYQYPEMRVTGIDISQTMIDYANGFVRVEGLDNAQFQIMDATQPLAFPDGSFDVVNARFMVGFLRRSAWPGVVRELARVTRPGGRIILTECDQTGTTNSEAYHTYAGRLYEAMRRSGLYAAPSNVTPLLGAFLTEAGCQQIHLRPHVLDFSAATTANVAMFENLKVGFKLSQPFLIKMGVATQEELDELYDKVLADMLSESFRALWYFLSVDGRLPRR